MFFGFFISKQTCIRYKQKRLEKPNIGSADFQFEHLLSLTYGYELKIGGVKIKPIRAGRQCVLMSNSLNQINAKTPNKVSFFQALRVGGRADFPNLRLTKVACDFCGVRKWLLRCKSSSMGVRASALRLHGLR